MHELGIAQAALEQALEQARQADARQIARIGLRVGVLSGVDPDALQFAFEAILAGTPADGAVIEIASVAAIAHCAPCGRDFTAEADPVCECPVCGQPSVDFKQGRELELTRLEVL
jgi:hydrogenase nickel incorporation protein HypA/HybF